MAEHNSIVFPHVFWFKKINRSETRKLAKQHGISASTLATTGSRCPMPVMTLAQSRFPESEISPLVRLNRISTASARCLPQARSAQVHRQCQQKLWIIAASTES